MAVGLHILYGVMGSGKTNYAVNELLYKSTYKHIICNVPLSEEFKKTFPDDVFFDIKEKTDPKSVIDLINSENPSTFFIVDESQLVLTSANVTACKNFAKKMSQIRQDDQDVVLIAQTSKMLPSIIKDVATDSYKFENNNVKGLKKSSHCEVYKGGYDYKTRLTSEFTYTHVYGNYSTSNWETTEKPKNLYKPVYIKLALIFLLVFFLLGVIIYKLSNLKDKYIDNNGETANVILSEKTSSTKRSIPFSDSVCVRSWHYRGLGIVEYVTNQGLSKMAVVDSFLVYPKCPLP